MARHIFYIAKAAACVLWPNWCPVESTTGQSIGLGVYEPKDIIQMFLIQLDIISKFSVTSQHW